MTVVGPLLVLVAFGLALFLLSQPFWPGQVERAAETDALRRADLEAAKVAKYREIRDAALDHSTGKLSDADWKPIDARLRTEAVAILDELDGLAHLRGVERDHEELPAGAASGTPETDPTTARDAARAGQIGEPGEGPAEQADGAPAAASDRDGVPGVGPADGEGPASASGSRTRTSRKARGRSRKSPRGAGTATGPSQADDAADGPSGTVGAADPPRAR